MSVRTGRVAARAFQQVEARRALPDKARKNYGAYAHKLPGMILQNGLAHATGFLLAKSASSEEHGLLLDDLRSVLNETGSIRADDRLSLHKAILEADLMTGLRQSRAALEAAAWLKRYVQGVLKVDATGETEGAKNP